MTHSSDGALKLSEDIRKMNGKKLLVADDSLTIQKVIRLALSNEGYDIQTVSDGNDALQQIAVFRPDVVLIDVSLPSKTAFEVKRAMNQQVPESNVKFILMSSAFEFVDEEQQAEVVFHGVLTKPFDPANLRQVLTQVLQSSREPTQDLSPALELQIEEPSLVLETPKQSIKETLSEPGFIHVEERVRSKEKPDLSPTFSLPPPPLPKLPPIPRAPQPQASGPGHSQPPQGKWSASPVPPPPLAPPPLAPPPLAPPPLPQSTTPTQKASPPRLPSSFGADSKSSVEAPPGFGVAPPLSNAGSFPPRPPKEIQAQPSFLLTPELELEPLTPPAIPDYSDIRHLTESTIRMSGLDDFQWSVSETNKLPENAFEPSELGGSALESSEEDEFQSPPSFHDHPLDALDAQDSFITPPASFADSGNSTFQVERRAVSRAYSEDPANAYHQAPDEIEAPFQEENFARPSRQAPLSLPPGHGPADPNVMPISVAQMEELLKKQMEETLQKMAQKILPDVAERILRQEIRKMLQEQS